jgi:hypothetical protein
MRAERRLVERMDGACERWEVYPDLEDSMRKSIDVYIHLYANGEIENILIFTPEKFLSLDREELSTVLEVLKNKTLRALLGVSESRELRALLEVLNTDRKYRTLLEQK